MNRAFACLTMALPACLCLTAQAADEFPEKEGDRDYEYMMPSPDKKEKKLKENDPSAKKKAAEYHLKNLKDEDPTVRENAAEMLGIINSIDAVPHLIELLDTKNERHIMVQIKAHGALNKITGKNFGYRNYPMWRKWWEEHGRTFIKDMQHGPDETAKVRARTSNTMGLNYLNNGEFVAASRMFLDAVNADPEIPDYRNNLGLAVMKQGRFIDAMAYFEETIGLDETLAEPYMNIGQCYASLGRDIESQHWFKRAIEKDGAGKLWESFWLLGKEYLKKGEYQMAYEFLDSAHAKAVMRRHHDPRIYRDLALTHYALDQYYEAWKQIKNVEAIGYALDPGFVTKVRRAIEANGDDPDKIDAQARALQRGEAPAPVAP